MTSQQVIKLQKYNRYLSIDLDTTNPTLKNSYYLKIKKHFKRLGFNYLRDTNYKTTLAIGEKDIKRIESNFAKINFVICNCISKFHWTTILELNSLDSTISIKRQGKRYQEGFNIQ